MIRKLFIVFAILLQSAHCFAQKFDPFNGQAEKYHADLHLFFPDSARELASRQSLEDSVRLFGQLDGWSVQNLRGRLDQYENLIISLQRHYQYFRLSSEKNRKDTAAKKAMQETESKLDVLFSRMDSVMQLPVFAHLSASDIKANNFPAYSYFLTQENLKTSHSLNPSAEKLSDALASQQLDRLTDRYDDLLDTIKPGTIIIKGKIYNGQTDKAAMLQSNDADVRQAAINLSLAAYSRHGELFAATLIDITHEKKCACCCASL